MKIYQKFYLCLLLLALVVAVFAAPAWANIAANTQIINTAWLHYDDGTPTGKTVPSNSVIVKVALVPGPPTGTAGPDPSPTPYTSNATQINTFTIIGGGNGPDSYTLTALITLPNPTGATAVVNSPASPVTLGATVTLSGSSTTVLNVPSDGINGNGHVNGIDNGDTVVIGTYVGTASNIINSGTGIATITIAPAMSPAPGAGVPVHEQQTVKVTVTPGTATSGTDIVIKKSLVVTSQTKPYPTVTLGPITDTFTSCSATLAKYVRNISSPIIVGTGGVYTYSGNDYYSAGVTAKPGGILEYILVATNSSATGDVLTSSITDNLPTSYVSLTTGVYPGTKDITYVNESGVPAYLSALADTDAATYATPMLTVNVGTGATSSAGGTIPAAKTVLVLYQVTVNP